MRVPNLAAVLSASAFVTKSVPPSSTCCPLGSEQLQLPSPATPTRSRSSTSFRPTISSAQNSRKSKSTALHVARSIDPAVISAVYQYFDGIRTPSVLIAASSITALFSFTKKLQDQSRLSRVEILVMRLYHMVSLLTFCFSTVAVLMSTSGSTLMLLKKPTIPAYLAPIDVYTFLTTFLSFEFLLTRWSFMTSQFCFVLSVMGRSLLEFDLLTKKKRRLPAVMVTSSMICLLSFLLSYINPLLTDWPNFGVMTKEVAAVLLNRVFEQRKSMQILSLVSFLISAGCSLLFVWPSTVDEDRISDHARYT